MTSARKFTKKLKSAVTPVVGKKSPGEENFMLLLAHFGKAMKHYLFYRPASGRTLKFSELKETLAKDICDYFADFREKKKELLAKPEYLAEVLANGALKPAKWPAKL